MGALVTATATATVQARLNWSVRKLTPSRLQAPPAPAAGAEVEAPAETDSSYLDTYGITRHPAESFDNPAASTFELDREGWLWRVLRATAEFRAARALWHRARARTPGIATSTRNWHTGRADGQSERGARLADCGKKRIIPACTGCGTFQKTVEAGCAHGLLCPKCMRRRIAKLRKRLHVANEEAIKRNAPKGYKARFITLTIPQSGDISADIAAAPKAWARTLREIQRRYGKLDFIRVLEWTPGTNSKGNSHMHVLIFAPYIGREWLAHIWGQALASMGYDMPRVERSTIMKLVGLKRAEYLFRELPETVYSPMVDVRLADPKSITVELVKYLVKDWIDGKEGERIEPELFAEAYKGLLGRRCIQTSRGYWVEVDRICPDCGETHKLWIWFETADMDAEHESTEGEPRPPP